MNQVADVVIVGGGIIGCSLAYALRKRAIEVIVLDQGEIGAQASSAATGMLAPLKPFAKPDDPYTAWLLESLARFPLLISELEEVSGVHVDYQITGSVRVRREKQLPRLQNWVTTWQQKGIPVELLTGDDVHQCEPGLASTLSLALYNPHDPQIHAPSFVQAFARAAEKRGAIFSSHDAVKMFSRSGTTVAGVQTERGQSISCKHLVLATGAWAGLHAEWLGFKLPVRPVRGLSLALRQPSVPLRHMVFGEGIYLAPKSERTIIAGVARDEEGFETYTTSSGKSWLYERAKRLIPSLDTCDEAWIGLLPVTPDARPVLGPVPIWENVLLACGYNGYGLLLSATTGDMIAEYLLSGQMSEQMSFSLLDRFSGREDDGKKSRTYKY